MGDDSNGSWSDPKGWIILGLVLATVYFVILGASGKPFGFLIAAACGFGARHVFYSDQAELHRS